MIDSSLLQFLSNSEQEALRDFEVLFESRGWARIEALTKEQFERTKADLILAKNWTDNRMAFGRLQVLESFLMLKESLSQEFDVKARERKEESLQNEVEDEVGFE